MIRDWLVDRLLRWLRLDDEQLTDDLAFAIAWRRARENLPPGWALSVAVGGRYGHATASLHHPDAGGHAVLVHAERHATPAEAAAAISEWLRHA